MTVEITEASHALGAVVHGVDASGTIAARDWDRIERAFRRHYLLVFRCPELDEEAHLEVMRRFGPLALEGRDGALRPVGFVSNHRPDGTLGSNAASFHIDYGFFPHPYEVISLYGLEIPPSGTETWFVSGVAAAARLPLELRRRIKGLTARQAVDVRSPAGQAGVRVRLGRLDERYPHHVRPVLWPHRTTGEEILAVWEQQTDAILPLEPAQSTALIEELFAHLYQPAHRYVHRWQAGDLVIWDNHALQHGRPEVGTETPRTLRRVCVGQTQDLSIFAEAIV